MFFVWFPRLCLAITSLSMIIDLQGASCLWNSIDPERSLYLLNGTKCL
jgi:hypothetical protein